MKRKNGFTLIELLAVIVILAIIALIAVPVVMNIIGKANKSAFKDSAYGLLKAGELFYTDKLLENAGLMIDKTFDFPDDIEGLEFKGSKPSDGTMTVRKDGKISMEITNGKYCVTKGFEDEDVTIIEGECSSSNGGNDAAKTLTELAKNNITFTKVDGSVYDEPLVTIPLCITNKTECVAGTPVAVEVAPNTIYKFYVLNDDITKNEVTLIMDRNLYSPSDTNNGNVAWYTDNEDTTFNETNAQGPLTALKVLKERTSGWTNIPAYTYTLKNDADGLDGVYTYASISKPATATEGTSESVVENVRSRLPRLEELTDVGCTKTLGSCKSWLYENLNNIGDNNTTGYWTSTVDSTSSSTAWAVGYDYYFEMSTVSSSYIGFDYNGKIFIGLRPVITLSK